MLFLFKRKYDNLNLKGEEEDDREESDYITFSIFAVCTLLM